MGDTRPVQFNMPLPLWGRYASLAEESGMGVDEYMARVLWQHGKALVAEKARPVETWTRDQLEERIVAAALAKRTTREIAQAFGMTNAQVNDIRRKHGVGTNQMSGPRAA